GHLAGDEVLRVLGDLLKQHARGSDMCSRYGGEEFLLVLPGMSQDAAARRAEQLRCALAAVQIPFDGSNLEVTASFGVATFPVDGATADSLISAADGALYASKAAGRNRVSIAERPQGIGVPRPRVPAAA
ncbi:MAG: GGDEF domain-containing protein, partial [Devosia sp.]|nr:GGDEF domain-containing protein [Devosia sp.]